MRILALHLSHTRWAAECYCISYNKCHKNGKINTWSKWSRYPCHGAEASKLFRSTLFYALIPKKPIIKLKFSSFFNMWHIFVVLHSRRYRLATISVQSSFKTQRWRPFKRLVHQWYGWCRPTIFGNPMK